MIGKSFWIGGMKCNSCALAIELALTDFEGIEKVDVDLNSGKATIVFDETRLSEESILNEIRTLGYSASIEK